MNSQHWAVFSFLTSSEQKFQNLTGLIPNVFNENKEKSFHFKNLLIQKGSGKIKHEFTRCLNSHSKMDFFF